jgi:hypothetical protein
MKRLLVIALILLLGFGLYWFKFRETNTVEVPKQEAIKTGKHSQAFNNSFDSIMGHYFAAKAAFVDADSNKAKAAIKNFIVSIDKLDLNELKKDTALILASVTAQLNDIKLNAESLLQQNDITEMRKDFSMVNESIYPLLKTIHYEGKILYWQNCPMAFGEDKGANWISNTAEIVNPYLGKNHPEFKATMLHCGEVKDSISAQ